MSYAVIQPPFTLKFREMSDHELGEYRRWFLGTISERLNELQHAVTSSSGLENWLPDRSPSSLDALGHWLAQQVETRPRTADELARVKERGTFDIDVSGDELTNKTFSLAMDVGMYLAETLLQHYPKLEWDQPLDDKKFADFGQMVLRGFGRVPLNPVRIAVNFCYGRRFTTIGPA
jgi:hypothetical protein